MKAEKIVTEIEKLNKLGILKKEIVIKKGKDEDAAYLADTYIAAVNTLSDDKIPEDVAKFYNELGDEIDAQTLVEKEEVVEEVVAEKKPAKTKDKSVVEKEVKKPAKKEAVKAKETKKEVVKEKPAKEVAKGKGSKTKVLGIGKYVKNILNTKKGQERRNDDILKEVLTKFPEAKTTVSCISWYRMDIKKGNK
jgi:outer membrane biosynthesis protein TonB